MDADMIVGANLVFAQNCFEPQRHKERKEKHRRFLQNRHCEEQGDEAISFFFFTTKAPRHKELNVFPFV
jgi:hypothetical protein